LRHDGHAFRRGWIVGGVNMRGGEVVGEPNQGILEAGEVFGASSPIAVRLEPALGRGARLRDELPHALHERSAKRRRLPRMGARKL
jgi:hypothetical protein